MIPARAPKIWTFLRFSLVSSDPLIGPFRTMMINIARGSKGYRSYPNIGFRLPKAHNKSNGSRARFESQLEKPLMRNSNFLAVRGEFEPFLLLLDDSKSWVQLAFLERAHNWMSIERPD